MPPRNPPPVPAHTPFFPPADPPPLPRPPVDVEPVTPTIPPPGRGAPDEPTPDAPITVVPPEPVESFADVLADPAPVERVDTEPAPAVADAMAVNVGAHIHMDVAHGETIADAPVPDEPAEEMVNGQPVRHWWRMRAEEPDVRECVCGATKRGGVVTGDAPKPACRNPWPATW